MNPHGNNPASTSSDCSCVVSVRCDGTTMMQSTSKPALFGGPSGGPNPWAIQLFRPVPIVMAELAVAAMALPAAALDRLEARTFAPAHLRGLARRFDREQFEQRFAAWVEDTRRAREARAP